MKDRVSEEVGKIFVNLGHLVFASLVFGSILKGEVRLLFPFISGGTGLLLFAIGVIILTLGGKNDNPFNYEYAFNSGYNICNLLIDIKCKREEGKDRLVFS
jgi:hypothetical protein